jgi:chromate reductase, NAD(P)H dehydrogenase (quinone)
MNVLAISGSLRAASVNSALLRATARLAPRGVDVRVSTAPGSLPLFNPDLEPHPPSVVVAFREAVAAADALIFASPEYAHGVSGVIKNALDWLVSFEPVAWMPVAVFSASPRSTYADAALRETLQTMSTCIVEEACFRFQLVGANMGEDEIVRSTDVSARIKASLAALEGFRASERPARDSSMPDARGASRR